MPILSAKSYFTVIHNNDEVIARWVSHVISPHIVGIVITAFISLRYGNSPLEILKWLVLILPLMIIPPLAYLMWLVRQGTIEDIYMPNRKSRIRPLTVMLLWLFICWGG